VRVLFLTHRLPYAPNRGDRIRAFHILKYLSRSSEVHLVSFVHDRDEESHATVLHDMAATVTTARVPRLRNAGRALAALASTRRPLTHVLLDSPDIGDAISRIASDKQPDVVLAYCSGMARFALTPPLQQLPFVLDMVDVDSVKWRELSLTSAPPRSWVFSREAKYLRRFEQEAVQKASATLVVNARERDAVAALEPRARIEVVLNGIDTVSFRPLQGPASEPTVIFCGVMNYSPNEQAALWLVREVWPLVRSRVPTARLILAGASPSRVVTMLASSSTGITVTGTVDDMRPYLWQSAVSVAPLSLARGLQNKVVEAIAAGLPCVVTKAVYDGLPEEVRPGSVVANDAVMFADAITRLLALAPDDRRRVSQRANLDTLKWEQQLSVLPEILERAIART
jgi:sugar transferase (PEP-CTERM/EpsH1 system associated)